MCARGFAAARVPLRRGNAGAAARAGVRPKGPQAVETGRRERYTEPGGRPGGPPLRGRRGGNPGPGGPVWDRPLRGSGTPRIGWTRSAHGIGFPFFVGGYAPLPHRVPAFRGADMHRCPHRVPAFRGADINRSPHQIPAFRRGGYYPPAVLGTRFVVGADIIRPPRRISFFCAAGLNRPPHRIPVLS